MDKWIESIQMPLRLASGNVVNPSPHPIQLLVSNIGNPQSWRASLFETIREEGINLEILVVNASSHNPIMVVNEVIIIKDDVKDEIFFWESGVVCYVQGMKPPFRIINGFIRRVWGKYGIDRITMGSNGAFVVRFRSMERKQKAIYEGPIL